MNAPRTTAPKMLGERIPLEGTGAVDVERQRAVVAALRTFLPDHCILWREEDTRPYECDGLTLYRQVPMVVALPETEEQVARIARELHDALDPQAGEEEVKRLAWAAALHEVGFAISHNDHHKHGAYLVGNADMAGFSTTDQQRIATLILAQRGNLKKVAEALSEPARVAKILALRLAVILCHARRPIELPKWTLRAARAGFELRMEGGWLARHPLTQFLLDEESAQWDRVGLRLAVKPL